MRTWGRGGAGNIVSEAQIKEGQRKTAEDLEANRTPETFTSPSKASQSAADYAHTGRGGAGNWFQPSELTKRGTYTSDDSSDSTKLPTSLKPQISTPWHPEGQELPVARAGRGGAGNFVWKDPEKEKEKEQKIEKVKERVGKEVERDVELGLKKPGPVVLGGAKPGRGW